MAVGGWLAELERERSELDLDGCGPGRLTSLAATVAKARRVLAGYATEIARAATAHAEQNPGAAAPEDVVKGGQRGESKPEAVKLTRRARALLELPAVSMAFNRGEVAVEIVDVIVKTSGELGRDVRALFVASDAKLAVAACGADLLGFRRWLQAHLAGLRRQAGLDRYQAQVAQSKLSMGTRSDGMGWFNGLYDPERAEEMNREIRALAQVLANQRAIPISDALQAEALHLLVTQSGDLLGRRPPPIATITDLATAGTGPHERSVAETWGGQPLAGELIERLACDADLFNLILDANRLPLDVGYTRRQATTAQRLALRALYSECPLSGESFDWCEIHHLTPWLHEGPTDITNLLPVSGPWHHRLHEGGWTLKMLPDRRLELHRPDGTHDRTIAPPTPITQRPRDGP